MSDSKNLLNPQGEWSNIVQYQARVIAAPTFDGLIAISCPSVDYNGTVFFCTPAQIPVIGVLPTAVNSGWTAFASGGNSGASSVLPWTPLLTCVTPGDLALTVSTVSGSYIQTGKMVNLTFSYQVTVTHTTATGALRIGGIPASSTLVPSGFVGSVAAYDISPVAGLQINLEVKPNVNYLTILKNLPGEIADKELEISDITTGDAIFLTGSISYLVA